MPDEDIYDRVTGKSKYTHMTAAEEQAYLQRAQNPRFKRAREQARERTKAVKTLKAEQRKKGNLDKVLETLFGPGKSAKQKKVSKRLKA